MNSVPDLYERSDKKGGRGGGVSEQYSHEALLAATESDALPLHVCSD